MTLYLQMRHLSLPEMWVAGGRGSALLGTVKRRARAAIRRSERLSDHGKIGCRRSVPRHSLLLSTILAAESRKPIL